MIDWTRLPQFSIIISVPFRLIRGVVQWAEGSTALLHARPISLAEAKPNIATHSWQISVPP